MGVREQMIGILKSGDTHRIHFSFTGTSGTSVAVDRTTFSRVAESLESNHISVVPDRFTTDIAMYSAKANASTNSEANTFYLGRNPRSSRSFDALIVHESVHASFDLTRSSIPWVDNEAAAYIAQGYYLRNSGYHREWLEMGSLAGIGYQWVNDVLDDGDGSFFLDALREQLRTRPMYHSYIGGTFDGDG
jgi:hypothetical protein